MPTTLVNWKEAQQKAPRTARWAVTMAKVRIRRVASQTRWQLVTFLRNLLTLLSPSRARSVLPRKRGLISHFPIGTLI